MIIVANFPSILDLLTLPQETYETVVALLVKGIGEDYIYNGLRDSVIEDVIPLSEPLRTADNDFIESVCIPNGNVIVVLFAALNCSVRMWGPDAKTFKPSRWFEGDENTRCARDALHGYRHSMTFGDGARICLRRLFVLTEFKAVLFVLVQNFVFEMADGPGVQIVESLGLYQGRGWLGVLRPKVYLSGPVPRAVLAVRIKKAYIRTAITGGTDNANGSSDDGEDKDETHCS
ncbi:cytochrome P450 [Suillus brevipes Sb2]|nr:cytochrome P450 [Suillus brevipes Sb2]